MYFVVDLPCIEEIENLKQNECVENECEMPRINVYLIENILIVRISIHIDHSTWSGMAICIFPRRIEVISAIKFIRVLLEHFFACKNKNN